MWDRVLTPFAPYATMVSDAPGCIANLAEYLKKGKYASIEATRHFVTVGIEATGVLDLRLTSFSPHKLGVCLKTESGVFNTYYFLLQ